METLYYVVITAAIWMIGLAFRRLRSLFAAYTLWSIAFAFGGLVAYFAAAVLSGVIRLGVPMTRTLPQDYFTHGVAGMASLVFILGGMLSPLAAGWFALKKRRHLAS